MRCYTDHISTLTDLNAEHVLTLISTQRRTLNGMSSDALAGFVAQAEKMGAKQLAALHAAETAF